LSHGNPVKGGSWTHFADTRRAYADLPQARKDEIEDLIVEHEYVTISSFCCSLILTMSSTFSLWHSRSLASPVVYQKPLPHELAAKPPAYHRLVQTAPDGRKTLYLAAHAKAILGRSFEDSQKLIQGLIAHCTKPEVSLTWLAES
jgi:alpha-ketoglutarate-dependent 2,4-dichlorophenoxyacetate dioxygenase